MRIRRNNAVTLIELLIVSVIISVVGLAIYSSFAGGLKVWKRVNTGIEGEDLVLFFARFSQDLRATVSLKNNVFLGRDDTMEFPVIAGSRRMGLASSVGRVSYVFNQEAGTVTRSEQDYSALFAGTGAQEPREMLRGIADLRMSYYCFDPAEGGFVWLDKWPYLRPPLAVRMELRRAGAGEEEAVRRSFFIPVGS